MTWWKAWWRASRGSEIESSEDASGRIPWIELRAPDETPIGAAVAFGREESARLIERLRQANATAGSGVPGFSIPRAVAAQLAGSASVLATAIGRGQVFQVIGPPGIVEGLQRGTYEMMRSGEGFLGSAVGANQRIVGQVRLAPVSTLKMVSPAIAWQVLHLAAGTSELRSINRKLDMLVQELQRLQLDRDASVLGQLQWCYVTVEDILAEHEITGEFSMEMMVRLAQVESIVGPLIPRTALLVAAFDKRSEKARRAPGRKGAESAVSLLETEGARVRQDMEFLVRLYATDLKIAEARALAALQHSPHDVQRRLEQTGRKVDAYREHLRQLPQIEELAAHARESVEQMGWFDRNLLHRGLARRAERASTTLKHGHAEARDGEPEAPVASFVLYPGSDGSICARGLTTTRD